ncbi:MAG: 50S ribosomal protein L17 [Candidatus Marinimicrobia bacterium]|jgi:large subunit ribosomal protein L17|nr:50S ribosomal protein L17 [Candidatus Neomarinimicrobiota bacterium]MBT3824663.1 50S ribosomal protein L17 [Candidatus Neomarinimicrobiota bacterium]MBT4130163.1 50S ribosomal protein L17 [Candidatus Neomarinimicrobiota bacterium]MBT4296913.1 50S ribosomal protein L17 [Candidatus Neomarinimicrobiota bacterium]MBT4420537.1 50S ribosomal protein L17 [Candidatus Neomarinimicrobiota bacterium]
MRHRKDGRKLGRTASHRKAMLANMAANLFLHKQIRTTHPKALEARRFAETLITKAKKGDLHSRRMVLKVIPHKDVVKILFDEIAPQYADRNGGYTRIIKLGQRKNDAAHVSILALVDFDPSGEVVKATAKVKAKKAPVVTEEVPAEVEETVEVAAEEAVEVATEEVAEEVPEVATEEVEVPESPAEEAGESEAESKTS